MSLKRTIHERCPRCDRIQAWVRGDYVDVGHNCLNPLPGPKDPPRTFRLDQVDYAPSGRPPTTEERQERTIQQQRRQLNGLRRELNGLRSDVDAALGRMMEILGEQKR